MMTYTIPQKDSNAGSIHDIASSNYERVIEFPRGSIYAVVLADYYGGKGYTTHRTADAVIRACSQVKDYSYQIIDTDGNVIDLYTLRGY